jgi:hypothetical protein
MYIHNPLLLKDEEKEIIGSINYTLEQLFHAISSFDALIVLAKFNARIDRE